MSQKDYIVINNLENHNEEVNENKIEDPLLLSKKLHQLILKYLDRYFDIFKANILNKLFFS
jgi:hypothetical protein